MLNDKLSEGLLWRRSSQNFCADRKSAFGRRLDSGEADGVYFYIMQTENYSISKSMILLK